MLTIFYVQLAMAVVFAISEAFNLARLPYSKFRTAGSVDTRVGMFLAYALPMVIYFGLWLAAGRPASLWHLVLLTAFLAHFAKRCLESLFLHRYSRPTPAFAFFSIAQGYATTAVFLGYFQNFAISVAQSEARSVPRALAIGGGVFVCGEVINFYHHFLLAKLRSGEAKEYRIPQGGLFSWVVCPHYLGEVIAFVGYALISRTPVAWGAAIVVFAYLSARSRSTLTWYQENLPDFPRERRGMIPLIL